MKNLILVGHHAVKDIQILGMKTGKWSGPICYHASVNKNAACEDWETAPMPFSHSAMAYGVRFCSQNECNQIIPDEEVTIFPMKLLVQSQGKHHMQKHHSAEKPPIHAVKHNT